MYTLTEIERETERQRQRDRETWIHKNVLLSKKYLDMNTKPSSSGALSTIPALILMTYVTLRGYLRLPPSPLQGGDSADFRSRCNEGTTSQNTAGSKGKHCLETLLMWGHKHPHTHRWEFKTYSLMPDTVKKHLTKVKATNPAQVWKGTWMPSVM